MKIRRKKQILSCLAFALPALVAPAQNVTAVPQLDLKQFTGTWYEVAHYPSKKEKHCLSNAIELVALANKARHIQLVNSCTIKGSYTDVWNRDAGQQGKTSDGRFVIPGIISFLPLFTAKYWVLALGPDYSWALVGSPNHKTLSVLSRSSSVLPGSVTEIQAAITAQGFSTSKITLTPSDTHAVASK